MLEVLMNKTRLKDFFFTDCVFIADLSRFFLFALCVHTG